jgi:hypothetical protein
VRKGLRFKIYEASPEQADSGIEIGCFSAFEIDKERLDPW